MRFRVLASDYDETLADDGRVDEGTVAALQRLQRSGRRVVIVTGRELDDLLRVFPAAQSLDAIVAENGAVLHVPSTAETRDLAEAPPPPFVARLRARHVSPLFVGRVIVATREPHQQEVLDAIKEFGLELQVIFNKGAVMVLPTGVNKGTGLAAALAALGLSARNCVAVGDAENDHALLAAAEVGVAVANALPALQARAHVVLEGRASAGVRRLAEALLDDDLAPLLDGKEGPAPVALGEDGEGRSVGVAPLDAVTLFAGGSGSGKSTAAKGLVERAIARGYQCCVIDPEGDYDGFAGMLTLGNSSVAPTHEEVLQAFARADTQVVVSMMAVPFAERPPWFAGLLPRLLALEAETSRPHFIVVDEAHHLLPATWEPAPLTLPPSPAGLVLLTVVPREVSRAALQLVRTLVCVGDDAPKTLADFCAALGEPMPPLDAPASTRADSDDAPRKRARSDGDTRSDGAQRSDEASGGTALVWRKPDPPRAITLLGTHADHQRHVRKYASGEMQPERSFYFRGPEGKLNLRAQHLATFRQPAEAIDDETWQHHRAAGDYSRWLADGIGDDDLAGEVRAVEQDDALDAAASRDRIRLAITRRYTLPASTSQAAPA